MTFQYDVQRPDGTHQLINEHNPVPVTVAGLPVMTQDILDRIAKQGSDIGRGNTQLALALSPLMAVVEMDGLVESIERLIQVLFWSMIGLGIVGVSILATLIVGVVLCL